MFDLFGSGVSHEQFKAALLEVWAHVTAINAVLVRAGLTSTEEYKSIVAKSRQPIEQMVEQMQRERNKEALEENPGLELLAKLFGAEIPLPVEDK